MAPSSGQIESLSEAITRFNHAGFDDDFYAEGEFLRARRSGRLYPPESLLIEGVARFEGTSDPDDQAIVFALLSLEDGTRGTYASAYGPMIDGGDAMLIGRLRADRR